MIEYKGKQINCDDCPIRQKAEAKPKSLLGRFWYWHIKWCPGWKMYQEYLVEQSGKAS